MTTKFLAGAAVIAALLSGCDSTESASAARSPAEAIKPSRYYGFVPQHEQFNAFLKNMKKGADCTESGKLSCAESAFRNARFAGRTAQDKADALRYLIYAYEKAGQKNLAVKTAMGANMDMPGERAFQSYLLAQGYQTFDPEKDKSCVGDLMCAARSVKGGEAALGVAAIGAGKMLGTMASGAASGGMPVSGPDSRTFQCTMACTISTAQSATGFGATESIRRIRFSMPGTSRSNAKSAAEDMRSNLCRQQGFKPWPLGPVSCR